MKNTQGSWNEKDFFKIPNPSAGAANLDDLPADFLDNPEHWNNIKADLHQALLGDVELPTLSEDFQKFLIGKYPKTDIIHDLRAMHFEYAQRIKRTPHADIHLREVQLGHFIELLSRKLIGWFQPDWHSIDRLLFEWKLGRSSEKNFFELHDLYKQSVGLRPLSFSLVAMGIRKSLKSQSKDLWNKWILGHKK